MHRSASYILYDVLFSRRIETISPGQLDQTEWYALNCKYSNSEDKVRTTCVRKDQVLRKKTHSNPYQQQIQLSFNSVQTYWLQSNNWILCKSAKPSPLLFFFYQWI